jgi:hypothetical protein
VSGPLVRTVRVRVQPARALRLPDGSYHRAGAELDLDQPQADALAERGIVELVDIEASPKPKPAAKASTSSPKRRKR